MCVKLVVFGGHTVILLGIHSTLRSVLARDECSTIRALHPNTPGVGSSDQVGRPIPNWTGFLSAQKPYFFPFCFLAACPNSECLVQNLFAQSTQNMNLRILISGEATGGSLCTRGVPRTNCSTGPMTRPMTRRTARASCWADRRWRLAGAPVRGAGGRCTPAGSERVLCRCCRVSLVRMPTAVTACSRMAVLPAVERRAVEHLTARHVLSRSLWPRRGARSVVASVASACEAPG